MNKEEIFDKTLSELADFNWLARKSLIRMEEFVDSMQSLIMTMKRIEEKIDTITVQTVKTEQVDLH